MFNRSIISLLTILIILSSCARSPKEITLNETNERVEKDILKIEQIKKKNETWEDNMIKKASSEISVLLSILEMLITYTLY